MELFKAPQPGEVSLKVKPITLSVLLSIVFPSSSAFIQSIFLTAVIPLVHVKQQSVNPDSELQASSFPKAGCVFPS